MLDSAQSQISFDDDNELFRQDTDAESDGEEQQELDEEDARDEQRAEEPVVELVPAGPPSPGGDVKLKEEQERKEPQATATPKLLPKGKEAIPVAQPPHSEPVVEKRKPLTLVELPVDVLKEIVKEVGLRHPPSAPLPPQLRVRQPLFYLPCLFLCRRGGGWFWREGGRTLRLTTRVGEPHQRPHELVAHVPLSTRPRHPAHLLPI